jgi:proto-oncogene C-crk
MTSLKNKKVPIACVLILNHLIDLIESTIKLYVQDQDDLPFKKGEVLTVLSKDEEQWWTARNSLGQTGSIPVPYIQKV